MCVFQKVQCQYEEPVCLSEEPVSWRPSDFLHIWLQTQTKRLSISLFYLIWLLHPWISLRCYGRGEAVTLCLLLKRRCFGELQTHLTCLWQVSYIENSVCNLAPGEILQIFRDSVLISLGGELFLGRSAVTTVLSSDIFLTWRVNKPWQISAMIDHHKIQQGHDRPRSS